MTTAASVTAASVKELARSLGADLVGIADVSAFTDSPPETHPSAVLPSGRTVVVLGGAFPREILNADKPAYTALRNSVTAKMTQMANSKSSAGSTGRFAPVPSAPPEKKKSLPPCPQ